MATPFARPKGQSGGIGAPLPATRRRAFRGLLAAGLIVVSGTLLLMAAPATATTSAEASTGTAAGNSTTTPECAGLDQLKIPASVMSLPTTGGRVESTSVMTSLVTGQTVEYCQVDADIFPVDPSAPDIKMRVDLPYGWNRKAMMFGGGGFDGTIPDLTENVPFGPTDQPAPPGPAICHVRQRLRPRAESGGPSVTGRGVRRERRGAEQLRGR